MSYFEVIRSGSAVPGMSIAIDPPGTSSTLSESLSLQAVVLCESATMLVVVLFDSLIASTVILPGALNSNIVSSGIAKSRAVSFLGESTLGFLDSLAVSIAILCNCLALTNVPSGSLT
jgi:hypothetical protein